ncbi:MAG: single-stranded-DNA-specific exonuclease RecJ [Thauera sp.]|jgi:single-stranded-DNA-specific exonuclease|nr:single-stranded-DNA-specific exonuclease RecJ [Thauera sp.]
MPRIEPRSASERAFARLADSGIHPLLARLYAARGIEDASELDTSLQRLLPPQALRGSSEAAELLADAIEAGARMVIIADYDCDGATACALGVRALRAFGADVHYLVPDRLTLGYGLTPAMVELAARLEPELIITVDNGIASVDGVAAAQALGIATLITDHHLPGDELPAAEVIVNPNQPGCSFPSKALAGVGVMFYTMLALRSELRARGAFAERKEPNLGELLDLVALGTVADVVALDHNNRILVAQGLARIRAGRMQPGVRALFTVAGRDPARASTTDFGFMLGPRLNAAGRLADMSVGIECLLCDDPARALELARSLDQLNRERRHIEGEMQEEALLRLSTFDPGACSAISLYEEDWHQGVVGIVAGRIKEKFHRPTIAFARSGDDELKGSGRSIPGLHLRDALDLVSKRHPELILRFGGHAMAAGLSIPADRFDAFRRAFEAVVSELLTPAELEQRIATDGQLAAEHFSLDTVRMLEREIWGQGFPPPLFDDVFRVERQRVLKDKHLKLELSRAGQRFEAIRFNHADSAAGQIHAAYRLAINEYQGVASVQLMLEHFDSA